MTTKNNKTDDEMAIRELKEKLTAATRAKDVAAAIAPYAEKSVMFEIAPPLQFKTGENAPGANGVQEWFDTFDGEWKITHHHQSVPMLMDGSEKAAVDLKP